MEGKETELEILSIVTHALIGNPEVDTDTVQLIVKQCTALVLAERAKYNRCLSVVNRLDELAVEMYDL